MEAGNEKAGKALDRVCADWKDEIEDDEAEDNEERLHKYFI
jgi:hypothetical protein